VAGRGGDDFSGGLSRQLGGRRRGDRVDVGQVLLGSVYPRKGKGYGVQGEAAYPDLLDRWDREAHWQSWRKGLALTHSLLIGAAERFTAVSALSRNPFAAALEFQRTPLLLASFSSTESPEGRWTVAIEQRGTEISTRPLSGPQNEVWYQPPQPGSAPLRLMELNFKAQPIPLQGEQPLHFNRLAIGEVIEDSAINPYELHPDSADGIGLLCMAVHETAGLAYFDASRYWKRERTEDGRLIQREIPVGPREPLPQFRPGRHLTQALTVSCNCPAHLGMEFVRLRSGETPGGQGLFPQRSPSGLGGPQRAAGQGSPEGVRRRFQALNWARIPGAECKHCHAVRFALGVPMAEPTDMPSPDSEYWKSLRAMGVIEEIDAPLAGERFLEALRLNLLNEQAMSQLDITLLAACVGDVVGVTPQRVELAQVQLGSARAPKASLGVLRTNEQWQTATPVDEINAVFGDWYVGRGTETDVHTFRGPGQLDNNRPAITPLTGMPLPRLIP
jgi:hypothetical protein